MTFLKFARRRALVAAGLAAVFVSPAPAISGIDAPGGPAFDGGFEIEAQTRAALERDIAQLIKARPDLF